MRVAVDLLGGDGGPSAVIAGVLAALRADSGLVVSLVGPEALCRDGMSGGTDVAERVTIVPASQVIDMTENPVGGVRDKNDATVCVAADLLADGSVDAMVSIGSTGAVMAASVFSLGLLRGLSRPALAVILPAATGSVVLLDVGANVVPAAAILAQHALVGSAYATSRLGLVAPRVGLLSIGAEVGKGDGVRRAAFDLLGRLPIQFVGNVEGHEVLRGGPADVVVTDGFTGNVLLKGMEGTYELIAGLLGKSLDGGQPESHAAFEAMTAHLHPDRVAGALLLGVNGVVVVGHGASPPTVVSACIAQAADAAVRRGALPALRTALGALIPEVSGPAASLAEAAP